MPGVLIKMSKSGLHVGEWGWEEGEDGHDSQGPDEKPALEF